jgi:undecaprenyl-diphosphatase
MTVLKAVVLGVVQGLTEFLPVSSSGHLVLMKHFFELGSVPILFDVLLHVATLVVVCVVFWERLRGVIASLWRWITRKTHEADATNLRLAWVIALATLFTGVLGLGFSVLEFVRQPKIVSLLFLVTAGLLIGTRFTRGTTTYRGIGARVGIVTGIAQAFGVLPGISRSGVTISASLFSGVDRSHAGEYSFLLSIPAIIGALLVTLQDAGELAAQVSLGALVAGLVSSFVVGWVALVLLLRLVRGGKLYYFSAYLIPLGIVGLILF